MLDVIPLGFEPKTHSLEGCCSIQLSYGTEGANIRIFRENIVIPGLTRNLFHQINRPEDAQAEE